MSWSLFKRWWRWAQLFQPEEASSAQGQTQAPSAQVLEAACWVARSLPVWAGSLRWARWPCWLDNLGPGERVNPHMDPRSGGWAPRLVTVEKSRLCGPEPACDRALSRSRTRPPSPGPACSGHTVVREGPEALATQSPSVLPIFSFFVPLTPPHHGLALTWQPSCPQLASALSQSRARPWQGAGSGCGDRTHPAHLLS